MLKALLPSLCLVTALAQAQEKQEQTEPDDRGFRIGVSVNQIFLSVTARSGSGGFAQDLKREEFRIYEDGIEQEIVNFSTGQTPVRVALLVDASGSTHFSQAYIRRAAYSFAQSLSPEDKVAVITFSGGNPRLILDWSNDLERLDLKLRSIWAKGKTALNDALYVTYDDLFRDLTDKKAVILLTDGVDSSSMVSQREVLNLAQRSEATAYVVSLLEQYKAFAARQRATYQAQLRRVPQSLTVQFIRESEAFLKKLTFDSGGRLFPASSANSLNDIYEEVAQEIKNQYYISYVPSNSRRDGKWRKVEIEVDRLGIVVRTRPGYFADLDPAHLGNR